MHRTTVQDVVPTLPSTDLFKSQKNVHPIVFVTYNRRHETATQCCHRTYRIFVVCVLVFALDSSTSTTHKLPRGLTGVLFLLLSPLPCLSLAPGDDTLLEFTSRCCQEGKRERVAMLYRSLLARHSLTRTIWCLLFLHSFLYPSCSLSLFLYPPPNSKPLSICCLPVWVMAI